MKMRRLSVLLCIFTCACIDCSSVVTKDDEPTWEEMAENNQNVISGQVEDQEFQCSRINSIDIKNPPFNYIILSFPARIKKLRSKYADYLSKNDRRNIRDIEELLKSQNGISRTAQARISRELIKIECAVFRKHDEGKLNVFSTPIYIPQYYGAIIGISANCNDIVIDLGRDDDIRNGFEFNVTRENNYICKLRVVFAFKYMSICKAIQLKEEVKLFDRVSTVVYLTPPWEETNGSN